MGNQRKAQAKAITLSKLRFNLLFILASGPHVESTHGNLKFTAPLTGITTMAGVILNLAVFFAWHVLWLQGFKGSFDWVAAAISLLALLGLFRYKIGVIADSGSWTIAYF